MTQGSTLGDLVGAALKDGWASTTMLRWSEGQIERQIRMLGYSLATTRDRQFKIEILKPTKRADAHPNSLSARYGSGQQPFHTDGAHHDEPPEIVLLSAQEPSTVPTLLWRFPSQMPQESVHDLREGLFTVRAGTRSFLAHAVEGYGVRLRVRYDPGCMSPADGRARRAATFMEAESTNATRLEWDKPHTVLAINNRQVLHARGDATGEPDRRIERAALRVSKAMR